MALIGVGLLPGRRLRARLPRAPAATLIAVMTVHNLYGEPGRALTATLKAEHARLKRPFRMRINSPTCRYLSALSGGTSARQMRACRHDGRPSLPLRAVSPLVAISPRVDHRQRQRRRALAVADGMAGRSAGPAARHAGAGPRLRTGGLVDFPLPRVRRAGVGDRPVVQRRGESAASPGRRGRERRVSRARRRAIAALRPGVLRRGRQHRFVRLLRHRRSLSELHRPVAEARRTARHRAGRAHAGDRRARFRIISRRGGSRDCGACTRPSGGDGIGSEPASSAWNVRTPCPTAGSGGWTGSGSSAPATAPSSRQWKPMPAATLATCGPSAGGCPA